jgi:excisionase family DNA binding protein
MTMALLSRRATPVAESDEKTIEINAQMQGTLSFKDPVNLKVNGNFNGTLECKGTLTIGNLAFVEAHITGDNIIIAGRIRGDVIAHKMLVLMPTAVLSGNISTPKLTIVEGAIFQGKCQMIEDVLDINEVSMYLEIEVPTILELADEGKIPGIKNGENWSFERSKIDNWAAAGRLK